MSARGSMRDVATYRGLGISFVGAAGYDYEAIERFRHGELGGGCVGV